tara:strand:+ start:485 stop:1705 length:1221 start_codon:yes stop_codon:yes gene_type:complete
MTNLNSKLDDISFPSGKNIKQCRQDSRRYKKKAGVPLSLSLGHILSLNGEYSSWQDFMIRAKNIFSTLTEKQTKTINLAQQTLFLSSYKSKMDNTLMNHWFKSLASDEYCCDIVIDVSGDTLKYAAIASSLQLHFPNREFNLLNMTNKNVDHQISYTNTFSSNENEIEKLLSASSHTLSAMLNGDSNDKMHVSEKKSLLRDRELFNLFSLIEREEGEGLSVSEMFSTKKTTLILLPSLFKKESLYFPYLAKNSDVARNAFFDILELIKKEQSLSGLPIRITLSGLDRGASIPCHLTKWLFDSNDVQTIAHCYYSGQSKDDWLCKAINFSEQSFLSIADNKEDVPSSLNALSSILTGMKIGKNGETPVLQLSKGSLVDAFGSVGVSSMPLLKKINAPTHKNGNKLKE